MKTVDLRSKSTDDLQAALANARDDLFRLRFQHATGQLENHRAIPLAKRSVARILTILKERDSKEAQSQQAE